MKMYFSAALSSLYDPEPSQKVSADVVFVHGLGGSTFHTWIEDNTDEHWWKDWIQSLKVHTCGLKWEYSPEWLCSSSVDGLARSFWRDIGNYREKIKERPLIIIAHSWGGLIVKQALVTAPRYSYSSRLVRCIQGPIFLGTPHSSNKTHWRNILGNAFELHPMGLPQSYKAGDETTVEAFAKISCAFRQVPAAKACVNFCRSEWKDGCMEDVGRPAIQRDAERQWLLDTSYNDKHPTFESPQFASFNHEVHYFFDLRATKYELATNLNRAVALRCGAFHTSGNALGAHLTLDDPEGLTSRHPGTCGWILENEQFRSRKTSSGNDILWLHGAPGSGKTVLSSFVVDQLRVEAKVSDIIFFYHQRQDSVDPAKELLRGIIQAIFSKSISFAIGLQNLSTSLNKTQGPLWPQAFRRYLTSILGNVPSNVSVYLILDVLDECNSVENVLLNEVLDLGGQLAEPRCQLKCLFSSRNNYYVRTSWGRELRINLDGELDVQKDIARFINDENIRLSEKFPAHRTHLNAVRDIILRHAQGLFLWARLVLNEFTRDILSSTEKLPTRTSHLPPNLDVIFQQCLSTIPSRYSILAARKFAWISCALRPLHLWELRDAILVGSTHASAFPSLKELDGIEGPNSEASILEHCGGLVFTSNDQTLHYVHHSVKEFLLGDRGSSSVSVFKIDSIQAQELLALTCLESLICEQICRGDLTGRTISSQPSGILDYASANWAYHYRLAEAGSHYLTNKLQLYLQYSMNIQHSILTGSKQEVDTSSNGYRNSILKICLQSGFVGLAKIYLEMGIGVDTVFNPCGAAPLHLAVANGHLTVVDMLIKKGANLNSRTHNQGYTGLHIAVFQANNALMLRLLEAGADPNEVVANSAETPLHRAVMAEDLDAVRLLLDFGANPNATTFFMKKTPLNLVAALGRGEVLEDLHLSQFHWCDIFLRAVKKSGNVKLPLLRGYALTASCNRNPMWRENQFSNENTRSGEHISGAARNIEVSLSNSDGWTPLHFAAAQGNDKIANLLIENGAQTDAETTEGRTPFMLASEHGHDVMAATLLSNLFNSGKDIWSSQYAAAREDTCHWIRESKNRIFCRTYTEQPSPSLRSATAVPAWALDKDLNCSHSEVQHGQMIQAFNKLALFERILSSIVQKDDEEF